MKKRLELAIQDAICGSVASNTRGLQFESSHLQNLYTAL